MIVWYRADRFGNDPSRDRRDAFAVEAIHIEAIIEIRRQISIGDWRARRQRGDQRQQQANGCVQAHELVLIREWEVEVDRLQIAPSMSPAVEDSVEGLVDLLISVWPKFGFTVRVHPRMHSGRQEAESAMSQMEVDCCDFGLEGIRQTG